MKPMFLGAALVAGAFAASVGSAEAIDCAAKLAECPHYAYAASCAMSAEHVRKYGEYPAYANAAGVLRPAQRCTGGARAVKSHATTGGR